MPTFPLPTSGIVPHYIPPGEDETVEHVDFHYQMHDKLNHTVDIAADYGASPDNTDFASRFADAAAAAVEQKVPLYIPGGTYAVTEQMEMPGGLVIVGAGKSNTTIKKAFDGDMFVCESNLWQLNNLTLEGDGANYSGGGLYVPATFGAQAAMLQTRIINMDDPCIYWEASCGSQFKATQLDAYRINALSGTGRYAIVYENANHPGRYHSYVQYASHGQCAIDFGGIDGVALVASNFADLAFHQTPTPTANIYISGGRWNNTPAASIRGTLIQIVGLDVFPQLTLESGVNSCVINGQYNSGRPIDNSGVANNRIYHGLTGYTPTFASSGGGASLGNGTVGATFVREGTKITASVNIVVGSTTNFGSGLLRIGLPQGAVSTNTLQIAGQAWFFDTSASAVYTGVVNVQGGTSYASLYFNGSPGGTVGAVSPFTWATGDHLRLQFTYTL